jgi:hypothetical protein
MPWVKENGPAPGRTAFFSASVSVVSSVSNLCNGVAVVDVAGVWLEEKSEKNNSREESPGCYL